MYLLIIQSIFFANNCFIHPIFRFWFLVTFGDDVTKILHYLCLHFARQDGQDVKRQKENLATKVTKVPKTIRRKYGINEILKLMKNPSMYNELIRSNYRSCFRQVSSPILCDICLHLFNWEKTFVFGPTRNLFSFSTEKYWWKKDL